MANSTQYDAYDAGRKCFEGGGVLSACPYQQPGPLRDAWLDGFTDAICNVDDDDDGGEAPDSRYNW